MTRSGAQSASDTIPGDTFPLGPTENVRPPHSKENTETRHPEKAATPSLTTELVHGK